ncbi:MAG: LemA family protein [Patescibacteria group bacterium]
MTYVLLAAAAIIIGWFIATYNGFVRLTQRAKEAWADIDVQLKRRYDLIPNLVETVKGYAAHEKEAFESVTKARAAAMGAQSVAEHGKAENMLTNALKSIFAVAEAYPSLMANQNFLELQRELSDTENKVQAARRFYNTNVRDLVTMLQSFPANLVAGMFPQFKPMDYFELSEVDAAAKEPVKVKF